MSLNIYISYGTAEDQVTALRLQVLAAVMEDTSAYVPPASSRALKSLKADMTAKIRDCDVFFGVNVLGPRFKEDSVCWKERAVALQYNKLRILTGELVIVADGTPNHPEVVLDPDQPDSSESRLLDFLSKSSLPSETQQAIKALATITLGLLMLAPQE